MAPARDKEFLPEVWGLYSLGTLWIILRFAVRLRMEGLRGLRLDDGLALLTLFAWTFTCVIIQITYYTGTNSDFTAEEVAQFDRAKFRQVEYGSKLFLGSWYAYLVLVFTLKGVVLILYQRIFFQRWQKWILRITTALCVSGFVGLTVAFSLRCLPYHRRWQVSPPPPIHCTASPKILIATSCVNAVTDVFLLSVPISLLWNLQKPLRTRIAVFILLASGMFVLAACITRVSLTVVPNIFVLNIARWGVREFCIAIIAVNSASLRPMFRKSFWTSKTHPHAPPKPRPHFLSASAQRARQRLSRARHGNLALNSTSAGASTIDVYIQRELGGEDVVFEDPDYQMKGSVPEMGLDVDLEKGKGSKVLARVVRKDSGFPVVGEGEDGDGDGGGGSAGEGDTRSELSRG